MNTYVAIRGLSDNLETTVTVNGEYLRLEPSLKLRNHSPTGFEWGYGGSGPAQLALAILLDSQGPEIALQHYQNFKNAFIAGAKQEGFTITEKEIGTFIKQVTAKTERK